jgi:tetratricopeptide (TPR) repeat protein
MTVRGLLRAPRWLRALAMLALPVALAIPARVEAQEQPPGEAPDTMAYVAPAAAPDTAERTVHAVTHPAVSRAAPAPAPTSPPTASKPASEGTALSNLPHVTRSMEPPTLGRGAPPDLRDVGAWVAWKNAQQIVALPIEARLFYRRGLIAQQSGQMPEALANVRGAIDLDPSFLAPHLTLAGWFLFSDPAQMLIHCAVVVDRVRRDFTVQLDVVANVLSLGLEALFVGLLAAGLIIVLLRRELLAHGLFEQLSTFISPATARWWVPVILALPFLTGVGLTLPVLGLLAFLVPHLRLRERVLFALLGLASVLAPFALSALDRFTLALRTDAPPFYETPLIEQASWDPVTQSRLEACARRDPENGFAQFALAWHARQGGQLDVAERAYRDALVAWPEHPAVLTDLGNVLAMRGHSDEALVLYRRASQRDAANAAAHFNASQLLTRRFEYTGAGEELRQASAIDFDLVKQYQSRAGASGMLPLVDVWPAPTTFWNALSHAHAPRGPQPLPLILRGRLEAVGWPFSLAALAFMAAGWFGGRWQHRRLPIRTCSNCGVVVCRRCARRRREAALCPECDRVSGGGETPEFSRVLLLRHRARRRDGQRYVRTGLAALVPGFGLLAHHRVGGPVLMLSTTWLLVRIGFGTVLPFAVTPRLTIPGSELPHVFVLLALTGVYAWSLGAYALVMTVERHRESQLDAATHGRLAQASRRQSSMAA